MYGMSLRIRLSADVICASSIVLLELLTRFIAFGFIVVRTLPGDTVIAVIGAIKGTVRKRVQWKIKIYFNLFVLEFCKFFIENFFVC